jgi:hypothetical protein
VLGRYEGVLHLEVATPGAAKPGDMPGVMNDHLLAREVEADRRLIVVAPIAHNSQPHESGGMAGPAAERPASGNPIAAGDGFSQRRPKPHKYTALDSTRIC